MDLRDYLRIFDEETQNPVQPAAMEPQFQDIQSTGQDNISRQKMVEDAVKTRRWSLIPQAIAGAGDVLSGANRVYGGGGNTGAQENVIKGVEGNIAGANKQFESGLQNDPSSDASKQYQNLLGKFLKKDPTQFTNMSAAQIKEQLPMIEKLAGMEQRAQPKGPDMTKRLQIATLMQNQERLNEDRDAKRSLQEQQQKEGKIQKHSTEVQKAALPELISSYNDIYDAFASGKDVAGIGAVDSHLPNWSLSAEGIRNRSDLQQMANTILKSRSGAAVSDQEYRRFLLELQAGRMPTEKALRVHLGKMGMDAKAILGQLEAGLPPEALEEYKSHPGSVSTEDIKDPNALYTKPGAGEVKRKTKDGRTAIFDANTKQFKRYE